MASTLVAVALLSLRGAAGPSEMHACQTARSKAMGYCDPASSFEARVADLLARLSTPEKLSLMGAHGQDICAFKDGGVPRLDIPSYTWCVETNTGVSTVCLQEGSCATTFPSPAAMAASFNRSLWRRKGATQSTEQRALFNLGATRRDSAHSPIGLNGWGPNINVVRDPKYGRNSELPSEDPYLNGEYAVEEVRGMQEGDDPKWPLKIHATLKHYTAYSVETDRFGFIGNVSTYDVYDSFLPQYEAAFQRANAGGVMCSYMSLRIADADAPATQPPPPAHPSCASEFLLNGMVRTQWGQRDALIVTDCEATASMYQHNHLAVDVADAAAKSINSGVDLNTGYPFYQAGGLNQALSAGTVNMTTINSALGRSLLWRFRLGLFDDPAHQSYAKLGIQSVNTSAAQQLVQEAAAQGLVLLRNNDSLLPLGKGLKVAVVGSHAAATRELLSDYYGDEVCFGPPTGNPRTADGCIVTIGQSITAANARHGGETRVVPGVGVTTESSSTSRAAALTAAEWADVVVLASGLEHALEHEGMDRRDTELPAPQREFALRVLATGKKVVLLLVNGGIVSIDDLLQPQPIYSGNCSTSGTYEVGVDLKNTVNQTYFKLGPGGSVEACCEYCAKRTMPSACHFFTYATDTTDCYLKATDAGRRKAPQNLVSGSCVRRMETEVKSPAAIVEAFYPNQAGAGAIGPALFGETNRWGKLPVTIYGKRYGSQIPIQQMAMRADAATGFPGRGYRYYTGTPLFEAFHGLSYTTFAINCTARTTTTITLVCTVTNTGQRDGDAVLLLFHRPPPISHNSSAPAQFQRPVRRLIDFDRASVSARGSSTVDFVVDISKQLSLFSESGAAVIIPGVHVVEVQDGPKFTVTLPEAS